MKLTLEKGQTLLDRLLEESIDLEHECGGTLACATCRVIVREGEERLSAMSDDELDMLDRAGASAPGARLACQATGTGDVVVEIPAAGPSEAVIEHVLPVSLTDAAARHFRAQLAKNPGATSVRLRVVPSGCSGFGYRVDPAESLQEGDTVFESHGVRIAVDAASLPRVHGTVLDVVQEGLSRRLRFENPNARTGCGCGSSFGV
jgi:iron-sulfur cluster assembly protein